MESQVEKAAEKGGLGNSFVSLTIKALLERGQGAPNFDNKSLCPPGVTNLEAAETCADYFSAISDEFLPLDMGKLPTTFSSPLIDVYYASTDL